MAEFKYQLESALTLERNLFGFAIHSRPANAAVMVTMLTEEDFVGALHKAAFRAIRALVLRNELPLDYGGVIAELQRQAVFESFDHAHSFVCSLGEDVGCGRTMISRSEQIIRLAQERRRRQALERALQK